MPGNTNLNTIYEAIGALKAEVIALRRDIKESDDRAVEVTRKADESRQNIHRRLDEVVMRTTHLESDLMSVKATVKDMQSVTDDVKTLRERAYGAGTLGVWLWRIGGVVMSMAAGAVAAYTWLTGRPPP